MLRPRGYLPYKDSIGIISLNLDSTSVAKINNFLSPSLSRCAFLHFCSVKRPKLKQENPSLSVGAMARQLSSAWKLMTPEQKTPYNEMAARDKQR